MIITNRSVRLEGAGGGKAAMAAGVTLAPFLGFAAMSGATVSEGGRPTNRGATSGSKGVVTRG